MHVRSARLLTAGAVVVVIAAVAVLTAPSAAWMRVEALTTGAAERGTGDNLEAVARYVSRAPRKDGYVDIAASATQVGHWRLTNRAGEPFTAAGPLELARAIRTLAPSATGGGRGLRIHLDAGTVFESAAALKALPAEAELSVLVDGRNFLVAKPEKGRELARIAVGRDMLVEVKDRAQFDEVLRQLERPITRSSVRMVALEPGGATGISRAPVVERGARHARPDVVDPGHLEGALGNLAGQIVLLSGRIAGDRLIYKPSSGGTGEISMAQLERAASASDANLVILEATSARQPGTRNWLWQRVALSSVEKALGGATVAEFLHALAGEPEKLVVRGGLGVDGRLDLAVEPLEQAPAATVTRLTRVVAGTWSNIVTETAGAVTVRGLRASMVTAARQNELGRRFLPGVPSVVQMGYLVALAVGLMAFATVNSWWRRIWPTEAGGDYESRAGLMLARLVRGAVLILVFVPAVGLAALLMRLAQAIGASRNVAAPPAGR
ncbi:MAG: hypothetical protein R3D44_10625 [Hyphomicrobiaceae bacterium]